MRSDVLPLGLKLDGRACLVVGSGAEVSERATALLAAGAQVHLVSEQPDESAATQASTGALRLSRRPFEDADLTGVWLAVLTDRDAALAQRMATRAELERVFFCAVDQPAFSSYSPLALARSGPVTVAISTNGRAPALARRLREELARVFDEAGLAAFAERLARLRDRTPSEDRRR